MRCIVCTVCDEKYQGYKRRFSRTIGKFISVSVSEEVIKDVCLILREIVKISEVIAAVHEIVSISQIVKGVTSSKTVSGNSRRSSITNLESDREMLAQ